MRHRGRYDMCWLTAHERGAGASLLPASGPSSEQGLSQNWNPRRAGEPGDR
jgi:hypothetical protein